MTVKRILAVLAAAGLIVGAVFLRSYLDDRSSSATDSTDAPTGKATVVCSTELAAACAQLDPNQFTVTVESAGTTLDRLARDGATLPDAWITLDPFPGMVDEARRVATLPPLSPTITAVATDAPKLAVSTTWATAFATACNGQRSWACLGIAAGQPWTSITSNAPAGSVLVGISDPIAEAIGLVSLANGVAGYFGTNALDASSWSDPGFRGWLRNVSAKANVLAAGATPLSTMLIRKTAVNVAATTGVELTANSAAASEFTVVDVQPSIAVDAVVGAFTSKGARAVAAISPFLVSAGWTRATDPKPTAPAGTFVALRALWKDNTI